MNVARTVLLLLALTPLASYAAHGFPLACTYVANTAGAGLEAHPRCARQQGGRPVFSARTLRELRYDGHRLAEIAVEHSWYYLKPDGRSLRVLGYDNGADAFSERLVRGPVDGKIAYFDRSFKQVIAPRYDWGWPFGNGRALVCIGCKAQRAGEHVDVVGGSWGYIDRAGKEVVPLTLDREQAMKMDRQP
jgi:hypothetical protein